MTQLTPGQIKTLRARAIAAGIDWDSLPPLLRRDRIVQPPKGSDRQPGLLPVSGRTFDSWVADGLVDPGIKFDNGVRAWTKPVIVTIALDGIRRAPGHGRRLAQEGAAAARERAARRRATEATLNT